MRAVPAGLFVALMSLPVAVDPPDALISFAPGDVADGVWEQTLRPESRSLPPESGVDCSGKLAAWTRQDGIQVRLAWFSCPPSDIDTLARGQAIQRLSLSRQARDQSVLGGTADLVLPLDSDKLLRTWIQDGYLIQLGALPCLTPAQVQTCAEVTGAMARDISRRHAG